MSSHGVPRATATAGRHVAKQLVRIEEYRNLVELIAECQYTPEVLALTTKLLSLNPEYYTIWNHRRLVLRQQFTNANADAEQDTKVRLVADDLNLLVGLLLEYPKCYWIWNYRLWLLEQAERELPTAVALSFWQAELGLVSKMLARDERNFHGWGYRRTVVASLERLFKATGKPGSMVEEEFAYTTRMIYSGLKNFSAWHRRSKLIPILLDERGADDTARRKMLDEEFDLIQTALTDPFNQSAWDYHAFLMGTVTPASLVEHSIVKHFTNHDRTVYFEREMDRIKEMLEIDDDCKLTYEALLLYSQSLLALDSETKYLTAAELKSWIAKLKELDPLRHGRWHDLQQTLDI